MTFIDLIPADHAAIAAALEGWTCVQQGEGYAPGVTFRREVEVPEWATSSEIQFNGRFPLAEKRESETFHSWRRVPPLHAPGDILVGREEWYTAGDIVVQQPASTMPLEHARYAFEVTAVEYKEKRSIGPYSVAVAYVEIFALTTCQVLATTREEAQRVLREEEG